MLLRSECLSCTRFNFFENDSPPCQSSKTTTSELTDGVVAATANENCNLSDAEDDLQKVIAASQKHLELFLVTLDEAAMFSEEAARSTRD